MPFFFIAMTGCEGGTSTAWLGGGFNAASMISADTAESEATIKLGGAAAATAAAVVDKETEYAACGYCCLLMPF